MDLFLDTEPRTLYRSPGPNSIYCSTCLGNTRVSTWIDIYSRSVNPLDLLPLVVVTGRGKTICLFGRFIMVWTTLLLYIITRQLIYWSAESSKPLTARVSPIPVDGLREMSLKDLLERDITRTRLIMLPTEVRCFIPIVARC